MPLLILAGKEYGSGSSRDWAAKGVRLLGVRAVIAESFERIHRSNLVGMGVLPLEFLPGENVKSLGLAGTEVFHIEGVAAALAGSRRARVRAVAADGAEARFRGHRARGHACGGRVLPLRGHPALRAAAVGRTSVALRDGEDDK